MNNIALILAAGKGTRMKSSKPKVLHEVCGKSLLKHVIDNCKVAGISKIFGIVGYQNEEIQRYIGDEIGYVLQEKQLGTGHAVMQSIPLLQEYKNENVIVLMGDAPLISSKTIENIFKHHCSNNYSATILSAFTESPEGYGRIIRDDMGDFIRIVEHKDASEQELRVKEINSGVYCFKIDHLLNALTKITNDNVQGEYYLTDVHQILAESSHAIGIYQTCENEIKAVNSKWELSQVEKIMHMNINKKLMDEGVTFINPECTYVHKDVKIGQDTIIYPNSYIQGNTVIGQNCIIGANCRIEDSIIGNDVEVRDSTILNSQINNNAHVGPYSYIRPNSMIGERVKIGDFVEVKNSKIGNDSKASHLTYIGDATVGERVNLGCGVVFVNYDGEKKYRTVVEDDCFVGCNTNLISPVTIKKGSYIAAGSTITADVPQNSLAIARCRQVIKENYKRKK